MNWSNLEENGFSMEPILRRTEFQANGFSLERSEGTFRFASLQLAQVTTACLPRARRRTGPTRSRPLRSDHGARISNTRSSGIRIFASSHEFVSLALGRLDTKPPTEERGTCSRVEETRSARARGDSRPRWRFLCGARHREVSSGLVAGESRPLFSLGEWFELPFRQGGNRKRSGRRERCSPWFRLVARAGAARMPSV